MELAEIRFAADSPLEGDGFELPVPGFRSSIFYTSPELGAAKGPGATAGFEDRQREVYRAPSQAGPGNGLLHRWRDEATRAGKGSPFEAGRDGFWLARWLEARGGGWRRT
jgi:hypothetical protein